MAKQYFEKFNVGDTYTSDWRTISESDLRRFLDLTGLREPAFESKRALSEYHEIMGNEDDGRWMVPGFLTLTFSLGLISRSGYFDHTGLALLGLDNTRYENPTYVNDEIRVIVETTKLNPTSGDLAGVVEMHWKTENQKGDLVMETDSSHYILKESYDI